MRTTQTAPADQIARARARQITATTAVEQTVRDLIADEAITVTDAATALGATRQLAYRILGDETPAELTQPALTPVVYLRGAGQSDAAWERIERAMWARGWHTVHDRTTAWHAARAGIPVVLVNFSQPELDGGSMTIARVRARVGDAGTGNPQELPIEIGGRVARPMTKTEDGWAHDVDAIARHIHPLITADLR